MNNPVRVTHLTSAHDRYDIRIFVKMCCSLAKNTNFQVSLIVADGLGDEVINGISIYDVGKSSNRFARIFDTSRRVVERAIKLNADIYHFHDPELLLWAKRLKKNGAKIIYDVHEDLPRQLLSKPYLNPLVLKFLAKFIEVFENWVVKKCDVIITVTPFIKSRFSVFHKNVFIVANFPLLHEFKTEKLSKENYVCYVGGLTKTRGVFEMIELAKHINIPLKLAGPIESDEVLNTINQSSNVEYLGVLGREEVTRLVSKASVGLCILHTKPNYKVAYPIKVFEYMAARTPVVASDFPLYAEIVEGNNCGLCVNPFDVPLIVQSINSILQSDKYGEELGENGLKAILKKYNWTEEENKLFEVYYNLTAKIQLN
ncbi:MAG: glycosyltransferase [Chitinophagales bacterium]